MLHPAAILDVLNRLTPGDRVDLACIALLLLCAGIGISRGISGEFSRLLSLGLAVLAGYWIYAPNALSGLPFLRRSPQFAGLIAFCVALLGGLICFLLLHYLFTQIFKIMLDPLWDRSLGFLAGVANAAILLALAFTLAMTLPKAQYRDVLCRQSRTGRLITPILTRVLPAPPEAPAGSQEEDETGAAVPRARPARLATAR